MSVDTLAIYPGSFDPLTNGHVDIIQRGAKLFDRIVVAILLNVEKSPLFTVAERVDIAREVFAGNPNVEVDTFDGLLVDYARRKHAGVIVRGLRAISDFEFEMQMALMNRNLNPNVETVFMMPAEPYTYVSSRLVKEVAGLGGSITNLVPRLVESASAQLDVVPQIDGHVDARARRLRSRTAHGCARRTSAGTAEREIGRRGRRDVLAGASALR